MGDDARDPGGQGPRLTATSDAHMWCLRGAPRVPIGRPATYAEGRLQGSDRAEIVAKSSKSVPGSTRTGASPQACPAPPVSASSPRSGLLSAMGLGRIAGREAAAHHRVHDQGASQIHLAAAGRAAACRHNQYPRTDSPSTAGQRHDDDQSASGGVCAWCVIPPRATVKRGRSCARRSGLFRPASRLLSGAPSGSPPPSRPSGERGRRCGRHAANARNGHAHACGR